jgi:SNF2 family DNA or RNA helicase
MGREREALLKRLRPVRITRLRRHVLKHLPPVQEREPVLVRLTPQILADVDEAVQRLLAKRRAWQDVRDGILKCPWGRWKNGVKKRHKLSADEKTRRTGLFDERVEMYFITRPWVTDEELKEAVREAMDTRNETPMIGELSKIRAMLALAKISTALEIIVQHEERDEPLIVFCQHVGVLNKLFEGREGWGIFTGEYSLKKRDELYQAFQKGDVKNGLGVSILSGAEGLNLTRAASMLFIDRFWNHSKNVQCQDRLNRPGAEIHDSITIWRLEADHAVDRLVDLTVREKAMLGEAIEDEEWSQRGLA